MQDPVKLLITFPQSTNIEEMADHLKNNYLFSRQVRVLGRNKLRCSFETMADLLEIDFINTFGATATKVINSRTFSQQMNLKHEKADDSFSNQEADDFKSSQGQFPNGNLLQGEVNIKTVVPRRVERLTSLQDELVQQQKIRDFFCLYKSEEEEFVAWVDPVVQDQRKQKQEYKTSTHISLQSQLDTPTNKEQSIWKPFLGGVALTSVLIGGFKLMKMFLR